MSEYIPGPWVYESKEERDLSAQMCDGERCGWVQIRTASGTIIGSTYMHNEAVNEANARLIAAAPDLLDALKQCEAQFRFYADEHTKAGKVEKAATNERFAQIARAAIAKSEG